MYMVLPCNDGVYVHSGAFGLLWDIFSNWKLAVFPNATHMGDREMEPQPNQTNDL